MSDWIDDSSLSADEKLARFEALNPEPTRGPLPGGAVLVRPAATRGGEFVVRTGGNFSTVTIQTSDLVSVR